MSFVFLAAPIIMSFNEDKKPMIYTSLKFIYHSNVGSSLCQIRESFVLYERFALHVVEL